MLHIFLFPILQDILEHKVDYGPIRGILSGDIEVKRLEEHLGSVRQSFELLVDQADRLVRQRKAHMVVENGIGFYGHGVCHQRSLTSAFPINQYKHERSEIHGVGVLTLSKEDREHVVYYSRALGIWVSGKPYVREDGAYCQITGEKISP